jgi:hypothetical protein
MCAAPQAFPAVEGLNPDQRWPVGVGQARPSCHHATDEILLVGHQASEAQVGRGRRAIQLITGHVSLFDAQNAQRFRAIRRRAEVLARCHQCADKSIAIASWHRQLIGELPREGDAKSPLGPANSGSLTDALPGAALGMASGHFVMNRSVQREEEEGTEMSLVPVQGGVMIAFSTDFPN